MILFMRTKIWHLFIIFYFISSTVSAQLKDIDKRVERKVQQRVDRKVDRAIDKTLDKAEKEAEDAVTQDSQKEAHSQENESEGGQQPSKASEQIQAPASFKAYSKFDFTPGEEVVAYEDFSQDAVGDFPAKWNTNSSAEVVKLNNEERHWLALTTAGIVMPDFINSLPENFTLEFELAVTPNYSYYDSWIAINLLAAENKSELLNWNNYKRKRTGIEVALHPQDAGNKPFGRSKYIVVSKGAKIMENNMSQLESFNAKNKTVAHVGIWRQRQRLRIYVNETKVWDLPRAFENGAGYNGMVIEKGNSKEGNHYYITDVRLAIGSPDTRNKLLSEGKFTTTGIYFSTSSATIKPESYAVIKEIAAVLTENNSLNLKIIGHTDDDGDAKYNLELSKKRALAVKQTLVSDFGIEESRIKTDGRGEAVPVSGNQTPAGKAANRRVEFVRFD